MFDVEKAVNDWSRTRKALGCQGSMSREEMVDHLLCEIERLTDRGMSSQDAFEAAKKNLTSANRNPRQRRVLLGNAIIWAALMLGTAVIAAGNDAADMMSWMLVTLFIPLWWASDQLIRRHAAD